VRAVMLGERGKDRVVDGNSASERGKPGDRRQREACGKGAAGDRLHFHVFLLG
jgi:hypothetical protein